MSDSLIQPCLQESEGWNDLYNVIERERSQLEEIAAFENQVSRRVAYVRKNGRQTFDLSEAADLEGLGAHTSEPRILAPDSFDQTDFVGRSKQYKHREKNKSSHSLPLHLASARPVTRSEFLGDPLAMEAYWKEWSSLEEKKVWRWETLCEWDDVSATARANEEEIHFGYLFGFMVIKGDEFPIGDPRRRWKYRIVSQGNEVKDQDWQVALFQAMATSPATLEASRITEAYSCLPGHTIQGRDVEQA